MNESLVCRAALVFVAAIFAACASTSKDNVQNSGFLPDYSLLKETKDTRGNTIRAWASPKLTPANYKAILLEPLVFHPEPQPSEQVSAAELRRILDYSNATLKQALSQRFNVMDRPGPGVLRLRHAYSGVAAQGEGLKAYQYIPIAFVATMATRTATGTPQRAFIVVETEGTDSVSGELLGQRVRVGTGERLEKIAGTRTITLETLKPLLDELAAGAFPELERYVQPK